jgi:UrcA family protein
MNAVIAKSIIAVTFVASLTGYSVLAHADDRTGSAGAVRSITVSYAELNLSMPQGIEALYSLIVVAAKRVCRTDSTLADYDRRGWRECYQDSIERAVRQVNLPTLTALHRVRTKSALG